MSARITPLIIGFGTAGLYGALAAAPSDAVLDAALGAGFGRIDTAPSYGFGRTEGEVAARVQALAQPPPVTTKVGLWPSAPPSRAKVAAGRLLAGLPPAAERALRRARPGGPHGDADASRPTGRFGLDAVRTSIESSLRLFGRIDRMLLHEVAPADITDELLSVLAGYLTTGDVARLGVAAQNAVTAAAYDRGAKVFSVAQFEVGPYAPPVSFAADRRPEVVVGHGLLGPAGSALRRLRAAEPGKAGETGEEWRTVTSGTQWEGPRGLARALLARASDIDVDEVVIATSRIAALPEAAELACSGALDAQTRAALTALISAS